MALFSLINVVWIFGPKYPRNIPMSSGPICDIYQTCSEMLASCKSKWEYERQYDTFG